MLTGKPVAIPVVKEKFEPLKLHEESKDAPESLTDPNEKSDENLSNLSPREFLDKSILKNALATKHSGRAPMTLSPSAESDEPSAVEKGPPINIA